MKNVRVLAVVVCMMTVVNFASADTIQGINIDFVTIGNAGNSADSTGYGAVGHNYRIGKYEVTNAQWNAFVTAAGAPTGNPSTAYDEGASIWTGPQQPTNEVTWYEAAQFCNYLTSGDKSLGAYQLGTDGSITVDRASAISTYGIVYVIPAENEWYKAAYYKPDGSGYSLYANGTGTPPIRGVNTNYNGAIGQPWDVGVGNGTMEQNGTFDMMGNVWEWNETLINDPTRGLRGGSYSPGPNIENDQYAMCSLQRLGYYPDDDNLDMGFRVASIPEPASAVIMTLATLFFALQRRKAIS